MILTSFLAILSFLNGIIYTESRFFKDSQHTSIDFNDEAVSFIVDSLLDMDEKINGIEHRLHDVSITNPTSQPIKEDAILRYLERIDKKLEDISTAQRAIEAQIAILKQGGAETKVSIASLGKRVIAIETSVRKLSDSQENLNCTSGRAKNFKTEKTKDLTPNSEKPTVNTNTTSNEHFFKEDIFPSCLEAVRHSATQGVYNLFIPGSGFGPFKAHCSGTGWTFIQRRSNGLIDFRRNWTEYKHGFGDPEHEYWIGLEKIYTLTSQKPHMLLIRLGDWEGNEREALYTKFEIGREKEGYYLRKVFFSRGNAGDSLGAANITRKFSTYDVDNDLNETKNCAAASNGAWWYDTCNWSDLNGQYNNTNSGQGINWSKWHGFEYSLKFTTMAIREIIK